MTLIWHSVYILFLNILLSFSFQLISSSMRTGYFGFVFGLFLINPCIPYTRSNKYILTNKYLLNEAWMKL
jgi:hypothetical protein